MNEASEIINPTDIRAVFFGMRASDGRICLVKPIEQNAEHAGMYIHVSDIDLYLKWIQQQETLSKGDT